MSTGTLRHIIRGMTEKAGFKKRSKRIVLWAGLILILLLMVLSIYGAFIGAEQAQRLFNSIPLSVYWLAFLILLIAGIAIFRRLLCWRGLFLIHLGCVIVLAGGIFGSQAGFRLQDKLFKTDTIRSGQMIIRTGTTDNAVDTETGGTSVTTIYPFARYGFRQ